MHDTTNHLIAIQDMSVQHIQHYIEKGLAFSHLATARHNFPDVLKGKVIVALFAENSTRTRISFEMATKRLGGEFILMTAQGSSIKKGEEDRDTLQTLQAMAPDGFIVRHSQGGFATEATQYMSCPVLNAGDGVGEHPTQALLDAMTLHQHFGKIKGLKVLICGDIKHSRVAHSNIHLLTKLGAEVTCVAPTFLQDDIINSTNITVTSDFDAALKNSDAVMMLRIQRERLQADENIDDDAYIQHYCLTADRLAIAPDHCMVLHPGPMNRGVEITSDVADDATRSLILKQVENGVYMRMACLDILLHGNGF